jgi:hypothetical protein
MDQLLFSQTEARTALGWSHSSWHRKKAKGEVVTIETPVGARVTRAELERLSGGKPIHIAHVPDPARQAAAAHARAAKADVAALAGELRGFMSEIRARLERIEATLEAGQTKWDGEAVVQPREPLGSRW